MSQRLPERFPEPLPEPIPEPLPEPWMRGPLLAVEPLIMPVFFSFTQVREDLARHTAGLTLEQVWKTGPSLASVGFHLRHIAGSVDRLSTYLLRDPLNEAQLTFLKSEAEPGASLSELLLEVDQSLSTAESRLRTLRSEQIHEARYIGRKRFPSTVLGLLVHLAEHTQRHLGQTITTAKWVRSL